MLDLPLRRNLPRCQRIFRINACWLVSLALISGLLGACVTSEPEVKAVAVPASQTVSYPGGQYKLYGSGTAASPYYWVWIPTGAVVSTPPVPPALPGSPVTQTVAYPAGQYQLYGSGTAASPYYWVWVRTGATVPPPPPLPR